MKNLLLNILLSSFISLSLSPSYAQGLVRINCSDKPIVFTRQYDDVLVQHLYHEFAVSTALFWWQDPNNCEDRANAMCKILNNWGIENGKVWLFNEAYPPVNGESTTFENKWVYHVAPFVIIHANTPQADTMVIDPDVFIRNGDNKAGNVRAWAAYVIMSGKGYYMLTTDKLDQHLAGNDYCVFDSIHWNDDIDRDSILAKSITIKGLTGYNSATLGQKIATLHYKTPKTLRAKWDAYQQLFNSKPTFLPAH